ncbi:MAG: DUF131 domain-containing protein [Archaeoglobaceae archaeon]
MDAGRLMLGFAMILIGLGLISLSAFPNVSYGALVMIGPIPIVVASESGIAIFLMLIAVAFIFAIYLLRWLR